MGNLAFGQIAQQGSAIMPIHMDRMRQTDFDKAGSPFHLCLFPIAPPCSNRQGMENIFPLSAEKDKGATLR